MKLLLASNILPVTSPPVSDGGIVIKGKKIIDIGAGRRLRKAYPDAQVIELGDAVLMPGLVNLHTHLELSHLAGRLGEYDDFFDWIQALIELRRQLGDKGLVRAASKALRQAIAGGTTCVGDISATDNTLPLLRKSGVRATVFLELIGLDERSAEATFKRLIERLDSSKDLPDRLTLGISPHSSYSVSGKLFKLLGSDSSCGMLPLAIHLSETLEETSHLRSKPSKVDGYHEHVGWSGHRPNRADSPISFIADKGFKNRLIAVHAVHVTGRDIAALKGMGASVAYCPRSNHLLRVGSAPVGELIRRGVNVGLGTDSLASNLSISMWDEMRFAYLVSGLPAETIVRMATINGAQALGIGGVTGSLEPGKDADLICVRTDAHGGYAPYPALVRQARDEDVLFSMVQGRFIYNTL